MATQNQITRYLILDECFRDPYKEYRLNDLLSHLNEQLGKRGLPPIKKRQLEDDLKIIRSEDLGFGMKFKKWFTPMRERIYRYENLNDSIMKMPLTPQELRDLGKTVQMLGSLRGLPNYKFLDEVLVRLKESFHLSTEVGSVHFDQCDTAPWLDMFMPLYEKVKKPRVINVKYHRFGRPSRIRQVHPYQLKQYNNRWYLVGYEERLKARCKYVILALDRIEWFEDAEGVEFIPCNIEEVEGYYRHVVGVSRLPESWIEKVEVKAYYPAAWYMETKPIHYSQIVEDGNGDGEYKIFKWRVMENEELVQQLMVYADQIEILKGDWVKQKLYERAKIIKDRNEPSKEKE